MVTARPLAHIRFVRHFFAAIALTALAMASSRQGRACGLTPPIGPTGLPAICHGDEQAPHLRLGLAFGGTSTKIDFGDAVAPLLQGAATGTLDLLLFERLSLSAAIGTALDGHIDYRGQRFALRPGPIGGLGLGYRLFGNDGAPFLHFTASYSIARSTTRSLDATDATFVSRDSRLGAAIGKTLGSVAAPFLVARYFGAGTRWSVGGGHGADHYRYHVGVGSAFGLSAHFDALVELAFLGERRASLGAGYTF